MYDTVFSLIHLLFCEIIEGNYTEGRLLECIRQLVPVHGFMLRLRDIEDDNLCVIAVEPHSHYERLSKDLFLLRDSIRDEMPTGTSQLLAGTQEVAIRPRGRLIKTKMSHISINFALSATRLCTFSIYHFGENFYTGEHISLIARLENPLKKALPQILKWGALNPIQQTRQQRLRIHTAPGNAVQSTVQPIGRDSSLKSVLAQVFSHAQLDIPVLVTGEPGTGKTFIANFIHYHSHVKGANRITVQCRRTFFTQTWLEGMAQSTVILEEVELLCREKQQVLLDILKAQELDRALCRPLGSACIIATTSADLRMLVQEGKFLEPLWHRLGAFVINLPPLRERDKDLPEFLNLIMDNISHELNTCFLFRPGKIEIRALVAALRTSNIRELHAAAMLACLRLRCQPAPVTVSAEDILDVLEKSTTEIGALFSLDQVCINHIARVLHSTGHKISGAGGAAETLGMNPSTLRAKMRKLNISVHKQTAIQGSVKT